MNRLEVVKNQLSSNNSNIGLKSVVIVSGKRTPIGSLMGTISAVSAPNLAASTIKANLKSLNLSKDLVEECILGNVVSSGMGQNPAR